MAAGQSCSSRSAAALGRVMCCMVLLLTANAKSATIGGKRCVVATTGQSVSSVALNVATADGANFANTNTGAVGWRAEFP